MLGLSLTLTLILSSVLLMSSTTGESGNPGFGTETNWGECQWTEGCGSNASGTQIGTETLYIFWIPIQRVTVQRNCTPASTPCGPIEPSFSLD